MIFLHTKFHLPEQHMRQVPYSGVCKEFIKIFIKKPTQKTKLGKRRYAWEDSIKMYLKEV